MLALEQVTITHHLPVFIVPDKDICIDAKPGSTYVWESSHHTVTLHVWSYQVKVLNKSCNYSQLTNSMKRIIIYCYQLSK